MGRVGWGCERGEAQPHSQLCVCVWVWVCASEEGEEPVPGWLEGRGVGVRVVGQQAQSTSSMLHRPWSPAGHASLPAPS